jgi:hypothetical protein
MLRPCFLATLCLLWSASTPNAQAPNPAPVPAATESAAQEKMEDPQVGDHWTYELYDDISGNLKSTFTATITDVSGTEISVRTNVIGNSNVGFVNYDRSWNRTSL